jgi:hypothetical protein
LLNFDADEELARPAGYVPARAVLARFEALAARAEGLVPLGDRLLPEWNAGPGESVLGKGPGLLEGRAFCPTPRALRALTGAGARLPEAPSFEVLRRVNHRAFCAELGQTLPAAHFIRSFDELEATLATRSGAWLLKRPFGYAGRGQMRLREHRLDPSVLSFARTSLEAGEGLQVEPWVERLVDVGLHGFLSRGGSLAFGEPTRTVVDDRGAWIRSVRAEACDLTRKERAELFDEAEKAALALGRAGYFGPFGIDGFRWSDGNHGVRFNPRCEINARYSMGWAVGMGAHRPDL